MVLLWQGLGKGFSGGVQQVHYFMFPIIVVVRTLQVWTDMTDVQCGYRFKVSGFFPAKYSNLVRFKHWSRDSKVAER